MLVAGGEVADEWDRGGDIRRLLQREHGDEVDLLVAKPIGARTLDAVPRPAAAAVYLAALDREVHLVAAGIAADELDLGAEQILQQAREIVGLGARAFAGEREPLCHRVLPGPDPARVPGGAQARARRDAAEPS